jgi:sigma-B regulation protein RsbU (phosphoserine phosphatase)
MGRPSRAREFFATYTQDLTTDDLGRLFTRDTPEAYRFFTQGIDAGAFAGLPWHRRWSRWAQAVFLAFTLRLSPARRLIFGTAIVFAALGTLQLFRGVGAMRLPIPLFFFFVPLRLPAPTFEQGTTLLILAFTLMALLVLLEVYDRISLKRDLEVAREIQEAMLPSGTWAAPGVEACGLTQPANTVGGDFYDILPRADGKVIVALGDVAGKASPAALMMALFLAMLRTLADEAVAPAELARRLSVQVARHGRNSRFITCFLGVFDPGTGELRFVNAGQTPPFLRRHNGTFERLSTGGIALAMFEHATYEEGTTVIQPGDALVMYSDGITEAESPTGEWYDDAGLERTLAATPSSSAAALAHAVFAAVDAHRRDSRLGDDLTVLVLSRPVIPPVPPVTAASAAAAAVAVD